MNGINFAAVTSHTNNSFNGIYFPASNNYTYYLNTPDIKIANGGTISGASISGGSNTITNIPNSALVNSGSLTVGTSSPLGGGGSVALGGTLTLTCATCLVTGGNLFTAAATSGSNSTISQGGTLTLAAGTDITTTNDGSGTITVANNSNLNSVTGRGASTNTQVALNGGISSTESFGSTNALYAGSVTNTNTGSTAVDAKALDLTLVGTDNTNANKNIITGINFPNVTTHTNNVFNGITFGTGFDNFLTSSTLNISAAGVITGATGVASSGTITFSGLAANGPVYTTTGGVLNSEAHLAVSRGGTGVGTFGGTNTILYTTATDTLSSISTGNLGALITSSGGAPSITTSSAADQVLRVNSANNAVGFGSLDLSKSGTVGSSILGVANGGTGTNTFTSNGILYGNGSGSIQVSAAGGAGTTCLTESSGGAPSFTSCPGASGVGSITGTINQVLANGTSGSAQTGAITLTLPQDIGTASTPTFGGQTLTRSTSSNNDSVQTVNLTNSASSGTITTNGITLSLVGTDNSTGANTLNAINFPAVTAHTNNSYNGLFFPASNNYTDYLNTPSIVITGTGAISGVTGVSASGTINFSGLSASAFVVTDSSKNLTTSANAATSSELSSILSDETGTGVAVFGTSPTITTSLVAGGTSFDLLNTTATTINAFGAATTLALDNQNIASTITLGNGTAGNTISIGNGTVATGNTNTINIGTSATGTGKDLVTIGSTNGASAFTIQSGTGGTTLTSSATAGTIFNTPTSTDDQLALLPFIGGSGRFTGTITSVDLTANRTYTLPDTTGTICLSTGNCAGTGTGVTQSGSNASGQVAYFTNSNNITSDANYVWDSTGKTLSLTSNDTLRLAPNGSGSTPFTGTITTADLTVGNQTFTLPDLGAATSDTICLKTLSNCVGTGGGAALGGSGTLNHLAKFTPDGNNVGNSLLADDGTTLSLASTATSVDSFDITNSSLTTGTLFKTTSTTNSAANTAWNGLQFNITNGQGTTAVSTGTIAGLDLEFNQNTSVAGNHETAAEINIAQNNSSSTDATVDSILSLANNDTSTGDQITATDGLKISGSNITNGIDLSGTFGTNLLTSGSIIIDKNGAVSGATGLSSSGTVNFSGLSASSVVATDTSKNLVTSFASAALASSLTDETGTGVAVFGTSPTITTSLVAGGTSFDLLNTTATTVNAFGAATTLAIDNQNTASTITLGNGTGGNTISIGNGTVATGNTNTISIGTAGTGTGKNIINIGGTNDASSLGLAAGTGGINLTNSGSTPTTFISTTANSDKIAILPNTSSTNSFTATISTADLTGGNQTFLLPDLGGATSATICTTASACASTGSVTDSPAGSNHQLAYFTAADNITGNNDLLFTPGVATGDSLALADSVFAPAAAAVGNLADLTFTNGSTNTSGTSTVTGLNIAGTNNAAGSGGTQETYGIRIQNLAGTSGVGTQNNYGIRIGNQGLASTENAYGLYIDNQTGSSTDYALYVNGGNENFQNLSASSVVATDSNKNLTTSFASSALASSLTDETGTGVAVFGTSPTISTSIVAGSTSMDIFNTTATTVNAFGAATTLAIDNQNTASTITLGNGTGGNTISIGNGTVANANTNTINIGTAGTGTGKDLITLGATNGASALTLQSGTGATTLTSSATGGTIFNTTTATDDQLAILPFIGGSGRFTGTVTSVDLTGNRTYTLPDATGTICISTGNCAGTGTGVTQSGTNANHQLAYFTSSNNITSDASYLFTPSAATGNVLSLSDSSFASPTSAASGNLLALSFTNTSVNTSGTSQIIGLNITPTNNSGVTSGATMETYGGYIQPVAGTLVSGGTKNNYGLRIGNQGQSGAANSYGLYVDSQSGSTNNYAAIFNGGNVGIGTTTPGTELAVSTSDAFSGITNLLTLTHKTSSTLGSFSPDSGNSLTINLVSYWNMNESSGTTNVADSYGTNTGTSTSSTNVSTGKLGNARTFNGSNQRIDVGSASNLSPSTTMSVAAWIKLSSTSCSTPMGIFGSDSNNMFQIQIHSGAGCHLDVGKIGVVDQQSTGGISDTNWHFVVATLDGTTTKFYIDGTLDSSFSFGPTFGQANKYIGEVAGGNYFNGSIDEVGFWNKTLSSTEVSDLYNSGNANTFSASNTNIGSGIALQGQNSAGTGVTGAQVAGILTSAANTAETGALTISTINNGGSLTEVGRFANSGTDLTLAGSSVATSTGLSIGALSGTTADTGISIGAISGAGATGTGISVGNISTTGANNIGIQLGTLTGGTTSNYGISTGTLTSISSSTDFQANWGNVVGASSATFGSIQTGAISGAGTTSYGVNLGANSSTATTNYGVNVGAISGAGTTNYGVKIADVSGASNNYALITGKGNVGINTSAPTTQLYVTTSDTSTNAISNVATIAHTLTSGTASVTNAFNIDSGGTLTTNLVSYWKMDESSGTTTVSDSIGANTLTSQSSTDVTSSGKIYNARTFNGSTDYLSRSDSGFPTGTAARSVTAWVKTTSTSNSPHVFAYGSSATSSAWALDIDPSGHARCNTSNSNLTGSVVVNDGNWHLISCTQDSSGNFVLYVDGVEDTSGTLSESTSLGGTLWVGQGWGGSFFNGTIDEVGFWNKQLSSTEESNLYNGKNGDVLNVGGSGIGSGLAFVNQNGSGTAVNTAQIASSLINVSGGAESSDLTFSTKNSGTLSEKARLDNNGNFGLGVASLNNRLEVSGNAAFGTYAGTAAAPTNGLIVSGNVGIGTSSPSSLLSVGSSSQFQVNSSGNMVEIGGVAHSISDSSGSLDIESNSGTTIFNTGTSTDDQLALLPFIGGSGRFTGTITSVDLTGNRTYTLPDATGTICISTGNCAGTGTGVTQSGTNANHQLAYFTSSNNITSDSTYLFTPSATSGSALALTDTALNTASANAFGLTFQNANTAAGLTVNGLSITENAASTPSGGTNTSNLVSLSGAAGGTVNGINFGSNLTNYLTGTNFTVTSAGAISAASLSLTTALTVGNGGTGATTFTSNGVLYGNGSGAIQVTAAGGTGTTCLTEVGGAAPTFAACPGAGGGSGTVTDTSAGSNHQIAVFTATSNDITGTNNFLYTDGATSGSAFALTDTALSTASANAANFIFQNANTAAGLAVNGLTITENAASTPSGGTNTSNLLNLTGATGGTVNGINFGSNLTNYLTGTNFTVTSAGAITAATTSNTINNLIINGSTQTLSSHTIADSGALTINSASGSNLTLDSAGGTSTVSLGTSNATTVNIGRNGAALTLASSGTSAWTNTSGNLTISTATSGTLALTAAGALNLASGSASTFALPANTSNALKITDGTNAYLTLNTNNSLSTNTQTSAFTLTPGTATTVASGASSQYITSTITPGTLTFTGTTALTGTGTGAGGINLLLNQRTVSNNNASGLTVAEASNEVINGPAIATNTGGGTTTITNAYGLNILAGSALNGSGGAVTNGYGLSVNAPTGATNNYAAVFQGGNVGIGTAAPGGQLEVTSSTDTNVNVFATEYGSSSNIADFIGRKANGTFSSPSNVTGGEVIAEFGGIARNDSGWQPNLTGGLAVVAAEQQLTTNAGTYLSFVTTAIGGSAGNVSEKMRLTDAGTLDVRGGQTLDITTLSAANLTVAPAVNSSGAGTGQTLSLAGGAQSGTSGTTTGGILALTGGAATDTGTHAEVGGAINITGGTTAGTGANNQTGGAVTIAGGAATTGSGTRIGGAVNINGGQGSSTNGSINIGNSNTGAINLGTSSFTGTIGIGNSSAGALSLASGAASSFTVTSNNLTLSTATSGTLAVTSAGALNLTAGAASTFALPANTSNALKFTDGSNTYLTLNTNTDSTAQGKSAWGLTPPAVTIATSTSAAANQFVTANITPGTLNTTGSTNLTGTGTSAADIGLLIDQPTISNTTNTYTISEASTAVINGAVKATNTTSGTETITNSYGLNILAGSALNGTNGAVTNGYGLSVHAPTGATHNIAAIFNGGAVGVGLTNPGGSSGGEFEVTNASASLKTAMFHDTTGGGANIEADTTWGGGGGTMLAFGRNDSDNANVGSFFIEDLSSIPDFVIANVGASSPSVGIGRNVDFSGNDPTAVLDLFGSATSGGQTTLNLRPGALAAMTAEVPDFKIYSHTDTITAGYTTQRFADFEQPTINAATSLTVTNASTVYIAGAPTTSGSAAITNAYALNVNSGASLFGGAVTVSSGGAAITGNTTINTSGTGTTAIGNSGLNWNITTAGVLTLGKNSSATGQLVLADNTSGFSTTFQPSTSATASVTYTLPTAVAGGNGYVLTSTTGGVLSWAAPGACTTCIMQVPTGNAANTPSNNVISPTGSGVLGLTINGTTNATTAADVLDVLSGVNTGLTSTNGIFFNQNSAGTTTNGLNITQTSGTLTNGLSFSGTIGTDITTGSSNRNLTIKPNGTGTVAFTSGVSSGSTTSAGVTISDSSLTTTGQLLYLAASSTTMTTGSVVKSAGLTYNHSGSSGETGSAFDLSVTDTSNTATGSLTDNTNGIHISLTNNGTSAGSGTTIWTSGVSVDSSVNTSGAATKDVAGFYSHAASSVTCATGGCGLVGFMADTPSITSTGANTIAITPFNVGSAGALTMNNASGTILFDGFAVTTPNITQTAGTLNSIGNSLTLGTITTGGTQVGLDIVPSNSNAAGTEEGILINNITAGAATEEALVIGTGWDKGIDLNSPYSQTAGTFTQSGGNTSINASSNFNTSINTGTSTGTVGIGNSSAGALTLASGANSSFTVTSHSLTLSTATSGQLSLTAAGTLALSTSASNSNITVAPNGTGAIQITSGVTSGTGTSSALSLAASGSLTSGTAFSLTSTSTGVTTAGSTTGSLLDISGFKFNNLSAATGNAIALSFTDTSGASSGTITENGLLINPTISHSESGGTTTTNGININLNDASAGTSGTSVANGILVTPTINTTSNATKTINGIKIGAPTLTTCTTGACTYTGLYVDTTGNLANTSIYSAVFQGGNVGIGQAQPAYKLDLSSSVANDAINFADSAVGGPFINLAATNATTGNRSAGLQLFSNTTSQWNIGIRNGDGNLHLYDTVNNTDRLAVSPNGSVGINNTNFNNTLNVLGGITANVLANVTNGTFTTNSTGGTLTGNTSYCYRVTATNAAGDQTYASTETCKTTATGTNTNTVTVVWNTVAGATGYEIYGRTSGSEQYIATVSGGSTTSYTDTGSITPSGSIPTSNGTSSIYWGAASGSTLNQYQALFSDNSAGIGQSARLQSPGSVFLQANGGSTKFQLGGNAGSAGEGNDIFYVDNNGNITLKDSTSTTQATVASSTGLSFGSGADGAIVVNNGTTSITSTAIESGRPTCLNSTSCADGIAYKVDMTVSSGNLPNTGNTTITTVDTPTGIAANDLVLLINLQGASGDTSSVGNYEILKVSSVSGKNITFASSIVNNYKGTTATNQKVVIQRIPQYTNVTVCGGNTGGGCTAAATLTANGWDGLATGPANGHGYYTGIVAFKANGTVTVNSGGTITASGLGYAGGTNGSNGNNSKAGESYDGKNGLGGYGSNNDQTNGGGKAGDGSTASPADGAVRGGGGGGGTDGSAGNDSNIGSGGGGGGAYAGGGGGGGAGGYDGLSSGSGGTAGTNTNGGGGAGASANTTGAAGGNAGSAGTSGTGGGTGGAAGSGSTGASGGGGEGNSTTSTGAGGGGGGSYGSSNLSTMFYGSGGGGGGYNFSNAANGASGANGGGIVYINGSTVTISGTVTSNGSNSNASGNHAGSGGAGAGGSVLIQSSSATLGSSLVTATGGTGTAGSTGDSGGGGAGGNGIIAVQYSSISGTTNPSATLSQQVTGATIAAGALNPIGSALNIGVDNVTDSINIGDASDTITLGGSSSIVKLFDDTGGTLPTVNGQFMVGSNGGVTATNGRIYVHSNGANFRFNSVANTADYSEYLPQSDTSEPGDVMVMDPSASGNVKQSSTPYDQNIAGAVTTGERGTGYNNWDCDNQATRDEDIAAGLCERDKNPHWANVGMLGQIYTKVSTENGPIKSGDSLTSSDLPGVAMKSTKPGMTVGKALEDFDGSTATTSATLANGQTVKTGTILVYVHPGFADPTNILSNLLIDSDGSVIVPKLKVGSLTIDPSLANLDQQSATASASLDSSALTQTGSLANGGSDTNSGPSPIEVASHLQSIDSSIATQSAQIASLSSQVASQSAQIASQSAALVQAQNDINNLKLTPPDILMATGSATLADVNVSDTISTLNLKTLDATVSGTFKSLGDSFLGNTVIAGDLTVNGTLSVTETGDGNIIDSLPVLHFQESPLATLVDFFNGLVTINKEGTVTLQKLTIPDVKAADSPNDPTIGSGTIAAGQTSVTVNNNQITQSAKVFVTPRGSTGGQSLYVGTINPGQSFTVSMDHPVTGNVNFDWWIVETK